MILYKVLILFYIFINKDKRILKRIEIVWLSAVKLRGDTFLS